MKVQVGSWKFKQVGIDFEELPKWYKVELCVRRILHWWVIEWIVLYDWWQCACVKHGVVFWQIIVWMIVVPTCIVMHTYFVLERNWGFYYHGKLHFKTLVSSHWTTWTTLRLFCIKIEWMSKVNNPIIQFICSEFESLV
jgi:hypothetical protein